MKKFRFLTLALCIIMTIVLLASCAAKNDAMYDESLSSKPDMEYPSTDSAPGLGVDGSISDKIESGEYERQIIKTVSIQAETKAFDTAISSINDYVTEVGG